MLTTDARVTILKTVSAFAGLPKSLLAEVAALLEESLLPAGQTLFEIGEIAEETYIIVSGTVRVHRGEQTLNELGPQDVFSQTALLESTPHTASVTAISDTTLLALRREAFHDLIARRGAVALSIIRDLTQRLADHLKDLDTLRIQLEQVILPLGVALSSERDIDRLLDRILVEAKTLCQADAGTIYLRTDDDHLRFAIVYTDSLGIAQGGPTGQPITLPPLPLHDADDNPNLHNVATYVALEGRPVNIPDVYAADAFDFSGARAFDQQTGYRSHSCLTVPLKDHAGGVIGVLQLFNAQDEASGATIPFDEYHQLVVESLTSQAAVALNTQMLLDRQRELVVYEHDLQVGRRIQSNFLPDSLPQPPGWELAARFHPAREVAGDFFDAFPIDAAHLGIIVADVCDKGVGAALFMALMRSLMRASAQEHSPLHSTAAPEAHNAEQSTVRLHASVPGHTAGTLALARAIALTNDYVATLHADLGMFATTFFGVIEPASGVIAYINGGHNSPVIIDASGAVQARLDPTGPVVGAMPGMSFEIRAVRLQPGDMLVAFTDGVTEAHNQDRILYDEERLLAVLAQPPGSASALLDALEADLQAFVAGADQFDDVTMMAVHRLPEPA
ncbi:MAG: SpoIIE family protein phosphatase [Anaerolineae bacterium]|nr:SpoIIE family protein phosphatase [Anaerolineae bacterium]